MRRLREERHAVAPPVRLAREAAHSEPISGVPAHHLDQLHVSSEPPVGRERRTITTEDGGGADAGVAPPPGAQDQEQPQQQQPPAQPGPASPPPGPAAVTVTGVTVANQRQAITYEEPSVLGRHGRKHFVTVAGSGPDVIIEASIAGGAPAPGSITWSGATPDPADPARATVSRARAAKQEVTATAGGSSASLTVWAVFAAISRVNGPTLGFTPPTAAPAGTGCVAGHNLCVWAVINNDAEIFPKSIVTDADRPNLEGAARVPPPGTGTTPCGNPLNAGAPLHWDFSRQIEVTFGGVLAGACGDTAFPANNAEGNDDGQAGDEMNDPYAGGTITIGGRAVGAGFVGDLDVPSFGLSDATGAVGDTATFTARFREFVRLEYHRTWWLISHRPTWSVDFRLRKNAAGHWVNDGSAVA